MPSRDFEDHGDKVGFLAAGQQAGQRRDPFFRSTHISEPAYGGSVDADFLGDGEAEHWRGYYPMWSVR